jgi:asparagine synthetase B (glutamine-hydrolysing)
MRPHDFRLYFGGIFRHEGADRLLGFDPLEVIQADYNRLAQEARRLSRSQRYCLVHLRSSGQGSIDKLERLVSAAGADLVHPFLMDEVFQLGFSLPPASKYRQGRTKLVPRTLAARTLSPDAAWGRRMGFSAPRSEWILGDASLREGVDLLREPGARVRNVASGTELDRLIAASGRAGGDAHADLLWVLLSIELWARELES